MMVRLQVRLMGLHMTKKMDIQTLMSSLDAQVLSVESGDLTLDESLAAYKEAIGTSKTLLASLDKKQAAFDTLKEDANALFE